MTSRMGSPGTTTARDGMRSHAPGQTPPFLPTRPAPKDSDFDHEISLVDHDGEESGCRLESAGHEGSHRVRDSPDSVGECSQAVDGESGINREVRGLEDAGHPAVYVEEPTPRAEASFSPGTKATEDGAKQKTPESVIDILYENQRGGFLCGIPLFSSMALGNLDPPPWTNYAHKPSPTDPSTAQVPDPSWEWAWPEWRINHDDNVDEDGWQYSFAFYRKFSWHRARWWNSFVRRRAWTRMRVRRTDAGYCCQQDPHMLNTEYFTVRPSSELARERSPSRASTRRGSRLSMSTVDVVVDGDEMPDIEHADDLLCVLRASRIDREKIEAVDNYLEHAQEDMRGLQDIMHDIMALFVFQASRRVLLTRLTEVYDKTVAERDRKGKDAADEELDRRVDNLARAIRHADEEVRRLEYWSDVKGMAEEGDSKGAVDHKQGWSPKWQGVDKSGPAAPPAPKHDDDTSTGDVKTGERGR